MSDVGSSDIPWSRWRRVALGVSIGAFVLGALAKFFDPEQFFRSYLTAFLFWLSVALGSLVVWLIHNLTGGAWGFSLRRCLQAATRTLPLLVLLFVPLAIGLQHVYPWMHPEELHGHGMHEKIHLYLNAPFFLVRAAIYFAGWCVIAWLLNRWGGLLDRGPDAQVERRMQVFSGPALAFYGISITFASVDWVMSLEPEWFSSIFGVLVATAQVLLAYTFALAVLCFLAVRTRVGTVITAEIWNDMGNLLMAFVMLSTYMNFSQFLLIWSGNLPEETSWYLNRGQGGWQVIAGLLGLFYFAVPFALLLSRDIKRYPQRLGFLAAWLVAMNVLLWFWLVAPAFAPAQLYVSWLDPVLFVAVGGLWLAEYTRQLERGPLLPPVVPVEEVGNHG